MTDTVFNKYFQPLICTYVELYPSLVSLFILLFYFSCAQVIFHSAIIVLVNRHQHIYNSTLNLQINLASIIKFTSLLCMQRIRKSCCNLLLCQILSLSSVITFDDRQRKSRALQFSFFLKSCYLSYYDNNKRCSCITALSLSLSSQCLLSVTLVSHTITQCKVDELRYTFVVFPC